MGDENWAEYSAWRNKMWHSCAPMTVAASREFQPVIFVTKSGELLGVTTESVEPGEMVPCVRILEGISVRGISTSDFASFSLAVSHDGCVYTWGSAPVDFGNFGQYENGDENCENWAVPALVQSLAMHRIMCVSAGSDHIIAVAETGGSLVGDAITVVGVAILRIWSHGCRIS